jgi:hypothetical protein
VLSDLRCLAQDFAERRSVISVGITLSFKDSERAKLCRRLDRWIESQFSKSAEGKAALKQGAARQ